MGHYSGLLAGFLVASGASCGGSSEDGDGGGGVAGVAGSGSGGSAASSMSGSAGAGGSSAGSGTGGDGGGSGESGSAGASGSGAESGSAGTGGVSGSAGSSGSGGAPAEGCTVDADCKVIDDCCSCEAVTKDTVVPSCPVACIQSACAANGLDAPSARCIAGACNVGFNCDTSTVTCEVVEPSCGPGEVPAVSTAGFCYAGCVDVTECAAAPSCASCGSGQTCVSWDAQLSEKHCVLTPSQCAADVTCGCLGTMVCQNPFIICAETNEGIACECPNC